MRKAKNIKDFDYYIDEYMYYCRSRKLRPKTMQSYEQTLRLFERWCKEEEGIAEPNQVREAILIKSLDLFWIGGLYCLDNYTFAFLK